MDAIEMGKTLRLLRKQRRLTQKEVAQALGYTEKSVCKWESGRALPPTGCLPELAKILQTDVNSFFHQEEPPRYLLGIDGGGTKTDFVLADLDGKVLERITLGTCNPVDIGMDRAKAILKEGILAISSHLSPKSISLFAGLAGGGAGDNPRVIREFLSEFSFGAFRNSNDVENAVAAGLGDQDGVTVIMGTGVVAFTRQRGKLLQTGGFGYLFDEGGSGYCYGRDGLLAALKAEEGSGPPTLLTQSLREALEVPALKLAIPQLYAGGKRKIASLAPLVFQAAPRDEIARRIVEKNVTSVARLIEEACRHWEGDSVKVSLFGGLMKDKEQILPLLTQHLEKTRNYQLLVCENRGYVGALRLAKALIEERN